MYAKVQCICGKTVKLNNFKSKKCRCGAVLRIGDDTPYVVMPENSLDERVRAGKRVVQSFPVLVEVDYGDGDIYLIDQLEVAE